MIEGTIYNAKLLIKLGEKDSGIQLLYQAMSTTTLRMKPFFILSDVLFADNKILEIEKLCKEMMKKCKNSMIPVQI